MRRRTRMRTVTAAVLGLAIVYLLIAYFVAPEVWVFRDATRVPDFSSMVTHTEQDIPGDPINIGLVGTKEQVIRAFAAAHWDPPTPSHSVLRSISVSASYSIDPISMPPSAHCSMRGGSKTWLSKNRSETVRTNAITSVSG